MSVRSKERRLETTDASIRERSDNVRFALLLTYITIGWMTIEGAASLLLGWASKSLILEALVIDSVIDIFSAAVLLWRLRVEASSAATSERVDFVERRAARLVGYSLYALVAYVLVNSGYGLFIAKRITDTNESIWGILIGAVAKVGMPILAGYKLKVAARLNSRALRADAIESITCGYLSIVLMVGLAATRGRRRCADGCCQRSNQENIFHKSSFSFLLKKLDHAYMRGEPSLRRTQGVAAELAGAECALKHAEQSRRFVRPPR